MTMKLTTRDGYTVETMARNITAVLERATPEQHSDGLRWYSEAQSVARNLAEEASVTVECAAGILAALSPRVRWSRNVELAFEVADKGTCPGLTRSTRNAVAILHGAMPMDVLGGPKTRAFAIAIQTGGQAGVAVVDVWATRAATRGKFEEVSKARYADVAQAYAVAARRAGLTVHEAQAIAWVVTRGAAA
jgi:hypothetical protein